MAVRIGELLLKEKRITPEQLQEALNYQRQHGGKLGFNLIKLGYVKDEEITALLSKQYGVPSIALGQFEIDPGVIKLVPAETAQKYQIIPLSRAGATLTIAMTDPTNVFAMDDIKFMTGYNVEPVVASETAVIEAIQTYYGKAAAAAASGTVAGASALEVASKAIEDISMLAEGSDEVQVLEELEEISAELLAKQGEEAPVVKLVNVILMSAIQKGASDIHIEPYEKEYRVRYRVDGLLYNIMAPPLKYRDAITSRIKIMSKLDIAEKRLPQDGRIKIRFQDAGQAKDIDFRVSVLPTLFGEKIVMRLLDKDKLMLDMTKLGFEPESLARFEVAISKPWGMVLVTGPTGSGKTNTLYSSIAKINTIDTNIMTAEDPVEFNMVGVNQVQVRENIGLNFAAALRSFGDTGSVRVVLRRDGYDVVLADNGRQALERLRDESIDLLLSDIRMPDLSGVEVLRAAKEMNRDIVAFMMTAFASTDTAVEAMRLGAVDYFTKPFSMDELRLKIRQHLETHRLKQENLLLKRALNTRHEFASILGRSDPMQAVFSTIQMVANTNSTVLITGESGTGKELVARAIHFNSLRRDRPFVAVNCGAVPETLLESELFGHMRGAFTGADSNKKGLMEVAEGGTIFLDEIGETTPSMQVKLLRVLQDRRFRRLGGTQEVQADVRVVSATNQDLPKAVEEGRFREDLFYRINVLSIPLPPLRERIDDLPLLADHFLTMFATQMNKPVRTLSADALKALEAHSWRGNVRELQNAIERAVALEQTETILPESLPEEIRRGTRGVTAAVPVAHGDLPDLGEGFDLEARGEAFYRHYLALALERAGGVQVKAAEMLGMSFRSFRYYAKKFNLR